MSIWFSTEASTPLPSFDVLSATDTQDTPYPFVAAIVFVLAAKVCMAAYRSWQKRPLCPSVTTNSSLNRARVSMDTGNLPPSQKPVNFTICLDRSGSMSEEGRMDQVKDGMNKLVGQALKHVQAGSQVNMSIVTFDTRITVACSNFPVNQKNVAILKKYIDQLSPTGGSELLSGINKAQSEMEKMLDHSAENVLVLLTDGDKIRMSDPTIAGIHQRVAGANARFYAVGIGNSHDRSLLQKLGKGHTYIDTTKEGNSIPSALRAIYEQTLAPRFTNVKLSTKDLPSGSWKLLGHPFDPEKEQNEFIIELLPEKLKPNTDLRKVIFTLSFTDPNGRDNSMQLPWRPNPFVDPALFTFVTPTPSHAGAGIGP